MAATKAQGKWFALFMIGLTAACAGLAFFSGGVGKISLVIGVVILAASLVSFMKMKPLEGKTASNSQPAGMKLIGAAAALLGWLVVLFGLHLTPSVSGRLLVSILGLAISLCGILYILPTACNKDAIWKS